MDVTFEAFGYVLAALLAVPWIVLAVELFAALAPVKPPTQSLKRPPVAVLVPAHNEENDIVATLLRIREQLEATDRLVVIADNCTDSTARVAASAGAEVFERKDAARRGKGFALAYGVKQLHEDPRPVLIVIDADSSIQPGAVDVLSRTVMASGRPAQAINLLDSPLNAGPGGRLAAFAFYVKNVARPIGFGRLGLPCLLYGTGMALPWEALGSVDFAGADITEDIRLATDLALAGYPPVFCPHPGVTGRFPESHKASSTQRRRWEHGHLNTIVRQVPRLLWQGLKTRRLGLIGLGFHLGVPPLALQMLVCCVAMFSFWLLDFAGPLATLGIPIAAAAVALTLIWWQRGRKIVRALDLLSLPWYAAGKAAIYARFLYRPERNWVRTDREADSPKK